MWTKIILEILVGGGIGWRRNRLPISVFSGFPYSSVGKESAYNAGDLGLIPGSGGSPGEGKGIPLQYSCLKNPTDRGAWWATVHGAARVGLLWLLTNSV